MDLTEISIVDQHRRPSSLNCSSLGLKLTRMWFVSFVGQPLLIKRVTPTQIAPRVNSVQDVQVPSSSLTICTLTNSLHCVLTYDLAGRLAPQAPQCHIFTSFLELPVQLNRLMMAPSSIWNLSYIINQYGDGRSRERLWQYHCDLQPNNPGQQEYRPTRMFRNSASWLK